MARSSHVNSKRVNRFTAISVKTQPKHSLESVNDRLTFRLVRWAIKNQREKLVSRRRRVPVNGFIEY